MSKTKDIPNRAHPLHRREPLPWHRPKSPDEDPQAPERVGAILDSPSYRRADDDVDFMATDGMRGVRLQIDYQKPELLLEEHRVRSTIVVFGSTRICEPRAARRKVEALTAELAANPGNGDLARAGSPWPGASLRRAITTTSPASSAGLPAWPMRAAESSTTSS